MVISILSHDHTSIGGIQTVQRQWFHALRELGHDVRWNRWRADLLIVGHVHLLPLLLLMPWRVRAWLLIYGIEAWRPLTWGQRTAIRRVERVISISRYTSLAALPYLGKTADDVVYPYAERMS